jgi:hypothetical protein
VGEGDFVAESGRFDPLADEEFLVKAGEVEDVRVGLQKLRDLIDGVATLLLLEFKLDLTRL